MTNGLTKLYSVCENILAQNKKQGRGTAGIEPATSRTQSENHTTRPSSPENFAWPSDCTSDKNTVLVCVCNLQTAKQHGQFQERKKRERRHLLDSNQRGQSPVDFESTALTTRPRCRVQLCTRAVGLPWRLRGQMDKACPS